MRKLISLILLVWPVFMLHGIKIAALPEVNKPFTISVNDGILYVSDLSVTFHIYSMKNFKDHKQVSRKGEGPGEFIHVPILRIEPDQVFAFTLNKCMFFSKDGTFKREFKTANERYRYLYSVGKNFVALKTGVNLTNNYYTTKISIFTNSPAEGFKYKKLVYYLETPPEKVRGGKKDYEIVPDYLGIVVDDDKVFIGDSSRGLFAAMFDSEGNELGQVQRLDIQRIKVGQDYKDQLMEKAKNVSEYSFFISMYNIVFPEYFPDFYRFDVDKGKIYFLTYNRKGDQREIIVTDFKSKILKRTFVPWVENDARIHFSIENDKFYYIDDNLETEQWELHMVDIK